jgi:hypothetical protein
MTVTKQEGAKNEIQSIQIQKDQISEKARKDQADG